MDGARDLFLQGEDWALACVLMQFSDFLNIFLFPKIQS